MALEADGRDSKNRPINLKRLAAYRPPALPTITATLRLTSSADSRGS
jgi:hypothetical protein